MGGPPSMDEQYRMNQRYNRPNQYTPYGSLEWQKQPGSDNYNLVTTLNPADQRELDGRRAAIARMAGKPSGGGDQPAGQDPY